MTARTGRRRNTHSREAIETRDEKQIRELNEPIVAAMTDEELRVMGTLITLERARRIMDSVVALGTKK
jgi:hypothetical protein